MTYEFMYEFMYMKNIVKSYLKSCVPRFQMDSQSEQPECQYNSPPSRLGGHLCCSFYPKFSASTPMT